jgi:ankyrin repeat protein
VWARNAKNDIDPGEIAARNERRMAILRILLAKGCNVDAQDHHGASVLYSAIYNRHTEMVEILLKYKANVNTRTGIYIDGPGGTTPLHAARWSPKLTKLLIDYGADESAVDTDGRTAEDWRRGTYPGSTDPFGADLKTDPFEEP